MAKRRPNSTTATRSPRRGLRLSVKLLLFGELMLLLLVAGMIVPIRLTMRGQAVHDMQHELKAVAATAALQIDGDLHREVAETRDADGEAFRALRDRLRRIAAVNGFTRDNIYTFFPDPQSGVLRFGVMIHDDGSTFVGNPYDVKDHHSMAAMKGHATASKLFFDNYGQWIAGCAPIRASNGEVVGLLEVARTADDYFARIDNAILVTTLASIVGLLLASVVGYLALRYLVIKPLRAVHRGMLALADHDFSHKVKVASGDELQDLGETLNHLSEQLNVARSIQAGFVPAEPPRAAGYAFAYRSDPCDATGGDYIDAFDLPDGRTAILLADVTGHGLGPSLIMASCRSALRALAQTGLPPGPLLEKLELQLADDLTDGRFITMVLGLLEPDGRFTYANAGHAPALIVRGGEVIRLDAHRPPLGIFLDPVPGATCALDDMQTTVQLGAGDRVVFTSDGVNETQDTRNRHFGLAPIERTARRRDLDAPAVIDQLYDQLTLHRAGGPVVDDITMLCVDRVSA